MLAVMGKPQRYSITIDSDVRKAWKMEAARRGKAMYALLEEILAEAFGDTLEDVRRENAQKERKSSR